MRAVDQFHLGIVTADFEGTMAELSSVFGYEWGAEVGGPTTVTLPGGETVLELRCAYSTSVPRLELVRGVPGTLWEPAAGIHHVGYWSGDVAADVAELTGQGYAIEASRTGPDGVPFFAFLRSDRGFRIELVAGSAREGLARCWSGGVA
ncbi:VOC family protein [Amycolatopsis sp. K13G38]|uniref:VOC family protein n=1 Tax=Amycolatopsis acididurans TaxID=2724524 RepID=A0ABX1IVL9_9PSEU|nr:VOC family protein [Amycolatopsis acididurans]NKQ51528.1 VOC family protein [Amycolatopsis acididurans]